MKNNLKVLFLLFCLYSLAIQARARITRTSQSLRYFAKTLDFGVGWMMAQYYNQTSPCVTIPSGCFNEFIFWRTSSTYRMKVNLGLINRIIMVTSRYFYYRVVVVYSDFSLGLFEISYNKGVISKLNSTIVATDIVKGVNGYAYFISKPNKMAYKIDLNSTFSIIKTKELQQYVPLLVDFSGSQFAIYAEKVIDSSMAQIIILDEQLNRQNSIEMPSNIMVTRNSISSVSTIFRIRHSCDVNFLLRISTFKLQVWQSNGLKALIKQFQIDPAEGQFVDAIICYPYLFVFMKNKRLLVYQLYTWKFIVTRVYSELISYSQFKCFSANKQLRFYSTKSSLNQFIYKLTYSYTSKNWTSFINNRQYVQNSPADLTSANLGEEQPEFPEDDEDDEDVEDDEDDEENNNDETVDTGEGGGNGTDENGGDEVIDEGQTVKQRIISGAQTFFISALQSESVNTTTKLVGQFVGLAACASSARSFMRPFASLLEDFWFYAYDKAQHPSIVYDFTSQIDLLNQLRIKPSFLSFEMSIDSFQMENKKMAEYGFFHDKAPDTLMILESIKDIYTINVVMVTSQFLLFYLARRLIGLLTHKYSILKTLYRLLFINSIWWNLLIGILQFNVSPIAFYCALQFNVFVSHNPFGKINLIFALFFMGLVIFYSFAFYPLLFKYAKKSESVEVLEISKFSIKSFWLEMSFKCLRSFLQATIHGFFINNGQGCLIGLGLINLTFLVLIILMRNQFTYKITRGLIFSYFLAFLCFDVTLLAYSFENKDSTTITQSQQNLNIATLFIILVLFVVSVLKFVSVISIIVYELIKQRVQKNRIKDFVLEENRTKDHMSDESGRQQILFKLAELKQKSIRVSQQINSFSRPSNMTQIQNEYHSHRRHVLFDNECEKSKKQEVNRNQKKTKVKTHFGFKIPDLLKIKIKNTDDANCFNDEDLKQNRDCRIIKTQNKIVNQKKVQKCQQISQKQKKLSKQEAKKVTFKQQANEDTIKKKANKVTQPFNKQKIEK